MVRVVFVWTLSRPTRFRGDIQCCAGAVPHPWLHRVHRSTVQFASGVPAACAIGMLQVPAAGMFRTVAISGSNLIFILTVGGL